MGVARKAKYSDRSCPYVCLSVCLFFKRVSGNSYTVENASNSALVPRIPEMKPPLAAVGSTTVAVLSQSSSVAAMRRGHVVYNNCALYMLYKQQCLPSATVVRV